MGKIRYVIMLAGVVTLSLMGEGTAEKTTMRKWSLEDCIAYALVHSPALAKEKLTVDNRIQETTLAEAEFDWTVKGGDQQAFGNGDRNAHSMTVGKSLDNGFAFKTAFSGEHRSGDDDGSAALSVELSKQILGGGSTLETRYQLEASLLDKLAAMNTYQRLRRKTVLDVTLGYYTIIRAEQSLKVKERALENSKRTLEITREREKPLDILTAELRVPDNELAVNTARRVISNGLESLKELIGMPLDQELQINGAFEYKVSRANGAEDLEFARENLETFLNNRLEQRKLKMLKEVQDERRLPDVTLMAAYRQSSDGDGYNLSGDDEQLIGVQFSWQIGRRSDIARYAIAMNNYEKNRHDFFMLNQSLSKSLGNYLRQLREYEKAVTLQESKCNLLRQKEELYQDRWENGEIDILELVRTQTDLEDSMVDLISKKVSYMELLANYHYLIGK